MTRILIVEDEPNMVAGLRDNFEYEGYEVITAGDGPEGLGRALNEAPDLVVLDVMMPKMSGLDVCKQLKAKRPSLPVIMLTARGQEVDKVVGLELGADDYVTKPFSIRELLARIKAVLRRARAAPQEQERYAFGDIEVSVRTHQVARAGKLVEFSAKEFDLLKYFLIRARSSAAIACSRKFGATITSRPLAPWMRTSFACGRSWKPGPKSLASFSPSMGLATNSSADRRSRPVEASSEQAASSGQAGKKAARRRSAASPFVCALVDARWRRRGDRP